ncbi:MAG: aminotransferase class I/II-fold pyridoxal phosphate-dependent enzyme, partial [Candidatus Omnitrophota bacterium]
MNKKVNDRTIPSKRRTFLKTSAGLAGLSLMRSPVIASDSTEKLAVLGGTPVRTGSFPSWPVVLDEEEQPWLDVLHKKSWSRYYGGETVSRFEQEYAKMLGVEGCLAVMNGTNALLGALTALEIGPGDEVLVPPYTFIATVNVVLLKFALPVFVDTDPESFQMDADKVEEKITERTRCIIPVHYGGNAPNMDKILAIAKKHNLPVVEDACQAHLAEWRGKKVGTLGDMGCFSFQLTKNLSCGEGGAIVSNNSELMDRALAFHNNSNGRKPELRFKKIGSNIRMTEFQGAVLLQGLKRLEEQTRIREQNGRYLEEQLNAIPGIRVAKRYEGLTHHAYHVYNFRYDKEQFAGIPRSKFLEALSAEGVGCGSGYTRLNKEPFIEDTLGPEGLKKSVVVSATSDRPAPVRVRATFLAATVA